MQVVNCHLKIILLLGTLAVFMGCAANQANSIHNVTVTLRVVGNEPFAHLVATFSDGRQVNIAPDSPVYNALWKHQGNQVIIKKAYLKSTPEGKVLWVEAFRTSRQ